MTQQVLDSRAENEKLQLFLFELDDHQELFTETAEVEGYTLDYSLDSLLELERYLADKQVTFLDASDRALAQRMNCWSYVGETFRENFGGGWTVSVDDPQSVNYGLFVIQGFDAVGVEFEPLGTLRRYLRQAKPGRLRGLMEAHVHAAPLDLSHLPEEE